MATFGIGIQHDISSTLLSQFSGALVDQYTNHVASIMFKDLKAGPQGQRVANGALSNLPVFFTPDEELTFGWGPDTIMKSVEVHNVGYQHLAIMIALAESFHSSWAAEVCHELAKSVAGSTDSLPRLSQWQSILQSWNGAFASIDFPVIVEDFIRLDPYNLSLKVGHNGHIPIAAKQVVVALHALSAVVNGTEKELHMTGSAILGWFAAVAEVLYDLRVEIFSSDGELLSGTKTGEDPQIRIIYREKPGIEVLSDTKKLPKLTHTMSNLGITSQQYLGGVHTTPFGGRVVWQSLLPRIFGASFGHLDREWSKLFSGMVGAGARMFEGSPLARAWKKT